MLTNHTRRLFTIPPRPNLLSNHTHRLLTHSHISSIYTRLQSETGNALARNVATSTIEKEEQHINEEGKDLKIEITDRAAQVSLLVK